MARRMASVERYLPTYRHDSTFGLTSHPLSTGDLTERALIDRSRRRSLGFLDWEQETWSCFLVTFRSGWPVARTYHVPAAGQRRRIRRGSDRRYLHRGVRGGDRSQGPWTRAAALSSVALVGRTHQARGRGLRVSQDPTLVQELAAEEFAGTLSFRRRDVGHGRTPISLPVLSAGSGVPLHHAR